MGTKQNPSPFDGYAKALPDEPMFTLLARDSDAPDRIRVWANIREAAIMQGKQPVSDKVQIKEALIVADEMRAWRRKYFGRWRIG